MKTLMTSHVHLSLFSFAIAFILLALALGTFALVHRVEAINPPPDGGYPGGNTAEGQAALLNLTSGTFNTAVGFFSLRSDTTSSFNTGVGAGTLLANTGDQNTPLAPEHFLATLRVSATREMERLRYSAIPLAEP